MRDCLCIQCNFILMSGKQMTPSKRFRNFVHKFSGKMVVIVGGSLASPRKIEGQHVLGLDLTL